MHWMLLMLSYLAMPQNLLPKILFLDIICLYFTYKTFNMKKTSTKNRNTSTNVSGRNARTVNRASVYEPISDNIYFDGYSYRVRVSVDGVKHSRNFSNKKAAIAFKRQASAWRAA